MTLAHFAKLAVIALFISGAHHSIKHHDKLERSAELYLTPFIATAFYLALLYVGGFFSETEWPQFSVVVMSFAGMFISVYRIAKNRVPIVRVDAFLRLSVAITNQGLLYIGGFYNF